MTAARAGDLAAFGKLVEATQRMAYAVAWRLAESNRQTPHVDRSPRGGRPRTGRRCRGERLGQEWRDGQAHVVHSTSDVA